MTDNFCKICGDILIIDENAKEKLIMKCEHCNKLYERNDNVLFQHIESTDYQVSMLVQYAVEDLTNPRLMKHCDKCKKETVNVKIGIPDNSLKYIYICVDCREINKSTH